MPSADHIPSFNHLRVFVRAKSAGRATRVAYDRQQVEAPADGRIFAHVYEKFITAVLAYVARGSRGSALDDAVHNASVRMRASYDQAARGMKAILDRHPAREAVRHQRSTVVKDADGYELVSIRMHVELALVDGRHLITYMHFPSDALLEAEIAVMETTVALAARQMNPSAIPAIAMVKAGKLILVDPTQALTPERIAFLRTASAAYRAEWEIAA
ncbi:hypothetical protein [Microbacterium plantarum]|uniref:hypothetical protein n=1 Tax=Microbacterium plantarum TaxID=1816425 RepID=UPI002B49F690|nr:hypothetical protein [Microbacterium plantarum]WRK17186.1 hypothetical protein VC184_14975 [Microbacterium plantarum]